MSWRSMRLEALAFLAEQLDFRGCLRRRLLGLDHLVAAVPLLDGPVRLVAEAVEPGDPVRGCLLAGGAAELIAAGRVRLFDVEGDVAVGEFLAFDPQLDFEGAALRDAEAGECLADDRLADPDDVGGPRLLALARLLPVLLLR